MNLFGIEPYEMADLDIRDASFVHEPAEMAHAVVEPGAQLLVVKEPGRIGGGRLGDGGHEFSPGSKCEVPRHRAGWSPSVGGTIRKSSVEACRSRVAAALPPGFGAREAGRVPMAGALARALSRVYRYRCTSVQSTDTMRSVQRNRGS
jgi:hypothetical protein